MSTTERVIDGPFAKRFVMATGIVPALLLLWDALHGQLGVNDVNFAIRTTGLVGLIFITLSLVVTPLVGMTGWTTAIAARRNLGVFGFLYLAAHFLIFFWWDRAGSVTGTLSEIATRRYLWFGTAALVMMIPLAITSTDDMISRLGPSAWKRLHRLAYPIAVAAVVHYYLLVKSDVRQPLAFAAVIGALLLYRVGRAVLGARKSSAAIARAVSKSRERKFWSGELKLARIVDETHDVKTFRFVNADGGALPFTHVAGQYLNLALTIDGKRVNRSYTIASSPAQNEYAEISVKHAADGYGSKHLHATWREGDRIKVSAPAGQFVFRGTESERVVLIAGGIGITPMMSVLRSLTDRQWAGQIYLLYSVRTPRDIAFQRELENLQARHSTLHVRIVVSADPDNSWTGARGRVTLDVIAGFIPDLHHGPILLCGPGQMMTAMRQILVGMGIPDAEILQEEFVSRPPVDDAAADVPSIGASDVLLPEGVVAAAFTKSGQTIDIAPEQSLLEAAEDAGIDIPYECRSGICGQCKTRLISGRVTMDAQDALTASDKAKGFILACQAHALENLEVEA